MKYQNEKKLRPGSGLAAVAVLIALLAVSTIAFVALCSEADDIPGWALGAGITAYVVIACVLCLMFAGLKVVNPNEALVLSLFGKYHGTIYEPGFYIVNPFCVAICPKAEKTSETMVAKALKAAGTPEASHQLALGKKVSTKIQTFVNGAQKVNDALGNPVEVSAIVVWRVVDATAAVINVDNYSEYLSNQTDSTIRNVARLYPYDIVSDNDDQDDEMTLRGSAVKIAAEMKTELQKRVGEAGIEILEVRLNQIAYAPEIAAAMLQRQQATAIIAARTKIVDGAVTMVEMALDRLRADGVVDLDEERKAQMVSNMMVVLCSNREASPIVNAGSIY